jgi:ABC-type transport system involved in multi-copper enzyme maturation permease subunit
VFLYGGISPGQLIAVFLFYVLTMLMLGSLGVLFSTLFKKTVVAVIVTYGVGLFLYVFTALTALFFMSTGTLRNTFRETAGMLIGLNPLASLISLFEPDFSEEFFRNAWAGVKLWHIFVPFHLLVSIAAVLLAIRFLRPRMKTRRAN